MFEQIDYPLLNHSMLLGAIVFSLGLVGFIVRQHAVTLLLSLGVMLQGLLVTLAGFRAVHPASSGEWLAVVLLMAFTVFVAVIAAVVAGPLRQRQTAHVEELAGGPVSGGHGDVVPRAPGHDRPRPVSATVMSSQDAGES